MGWRLSLSTVMAAGAHGRLGFHDARGNCSFVSAAAPPARPQHDGVPRSASVSALGCLQGDLTPVQASGQETLLPTVTLFVSQRRYLNYAKCYGSSNVKV